MIAQCRSVTMRNDSAKKGSVMSKPIPDKAEVALEYPDKLYIGTFEQSSRFDAHLDEVRKSIRMHFHYGLFAEILTDLARTVAAMPLADADHRITLRDAAEALYGALGSNVVTKPAATSKRGK